MTRYRRKLLALAGITLVALSIAYVARPVGHVPLYDANLARLAETPLQGYCAGEAFWISGGGGDAALAATCRGREAGKRPNKLDILRVQPAFCQAVVDQGWEGTVPDCMGILAEQQLWPTYDGMLTNAWNRARPYPRPVIETRKPAVQDRSRTGEHQGPKREGVQSR